MEKATMKDGHLPSGLAEASHQLMPIQFFYEKSGRVMPEFSFLEGAEVPYPYRSLLVHENDMTPTLAAFHHSKLYLEVHRHEATDDYLIRLVTLHAESNDAPVEFGAIGIQLKNLPPEIRKLIVEGRLPLGGILKEYQFSHSGKPLAFFSVPADRLIADSLNQHPGEIVYGRCNQLFDGDGMVIADIVEILPRHTESEKWMDNVK